MQKAEYVVCANIHENPSREVVMEAAAVAKKNQCDLIVALGGGTGKAQPLLNPALPIVIITALENLRKECGVDDPKMSDYGFKPEESMTLAVNARKTMGGLFLANPCEMSEEECAVIFDKSYR